MESNDDLMQLFAQLATSNTVQSEYPAAPKCYDGTKFYSSRLARLRFLDSLQNTNKVLESSRETRSDLLFQSSRPAIEHGIVPPESSFKSLRQVTVREVVKKIHHIHIDCVLLLTVVHEPICMIGTSLLVQDSKNDSILLCLYNYVPSDEDPAKIFPIGTRFALLAPYMKTACDIVSENLMLRCDNPQCVVFCDEQDYVWEDGIHVQTDGKLSPSVLRGKGNVEFKAGNLKAAERFYTQALNTVVIENETHKADKVACLSNRSEVRLRQERWEDAMNDSLNVLQFQPDHLKSKFRLAKALVRRGRSSEAIILGKEVIDQNPPNKSMVNRFVKDCQRLISEEGGTFDYEQMRKEVRFTEGRNQQFHADYVSPDVQIGVTIQSSSGISYRGCKATKALPEDLIIVASKAFAYAAKGSVKTASFEIDKYSKTLRNENTLSLVGQVVKLLWNNPSLGRCVYSLSAGHEFGTMDPNDMNKIDLPRIRGILSANTFAQSSENESIYFKMEQVLHAKEHGRPMTELEFEDKKAEMDLKQGSGLWIKESMFNHSCTPNCNWSQIGDHMFIRTTRAVKEGEELCISYLSLEESYEERKDKFDNWVKPNVGFTCACELCHLYRNNDRLKQLALKVDEAYHNAAMEVTLNYVSKVVAGENAMPSRLRKSVMDKFDHLPLHLQHNTMKKLHILEGVYMKANGDNQGALRSYERAAEIGCAIRGNTTFDYFFDLWRITGAAMACRRVDVAKSSLEEIWQSRDMQSLPQNFARDTFWDLTFKYAMPWWIDARSVEKEFILDALLDEVYRSNT